MISYTLKGVTLQRSSSKLFPEDTLVRAVEILKAVAHSDRLQIVNILLYGECQVFVFWKAMGIKLSQTSQQLKKLKSTGVVKSRKDGKKMYYSLANDSIKKIVKSIIVDI